MRWKRSVAAVGLVTGTARLADLADRVDPHPGVPAAAATEGLATAGPATPLAAGARGPGVIRWQEDLNEWIAAAAPERAPVAVDGVFGPGTEDATRAFQAADPDVPTDLVVDPEDQLALARAVAEG